MKYGYYFGRKLFLPYEASLLLQEKNATAQWSKKSFLPK
jgi:hypothetical protein